MQREILIDRFLDNSHNLIKAWKAHFYKALGNEALSPAQVGILFLLKRRQPVTGSAIATELYISRSAVTQLLDALQECGYIEKYEDQQDHRITHIRLSEKGLQKANELDEIRREIFLKVTDSLSNEELELVTSINAKMIREFEK